MIAADYGANLRAVLSHATVDDYADGREWYPTAQGEACAIAQAADIRPDSAAAIIAALSPRNKWERNLQDARAVAIDPAAHPAVCTFGANARKAERIASGEPWQAVLAGPKVRAFVANLTGDGAAVTVDVWAVRAVTNGYRSVVGPFSVYRAIADAYTAVAGELGMRPCDLQATAWIVARRIFGKGI